uniref:UvrABC system protein A n=1 Tax=candidate division WOR-3 bacterium TaxID=2052148 RepID=A0A7C6EBE0_UNCW3
MKNDYILVKGAREHNLKNIDVKIPRNKLVVITGISGSGKSSLAFDTIYAEGQRRYIESLSAYARQFLGMLEKPNVDYIEGLSPAIAIEQRTSARNPRSTVGTVTEIYDYLRLLFARIGIPYCPNCNKKISSQTTDQIVDSILALGENNKIEILAPLVRGRKGEYKELLQKAKRRGFIRVRVDGKIYEVEEVPELHKYKKHNIEIVVDRLLIKSDIRKRLADSLEIALKEGEGLCIVNVEGKEEKIFSSALACVDCGFSYEEVSPRLFSFNSPYGACPTCHGLGTRMEIDPDRLIPNPNLSVMEGAIESWGEPSSNWFISQLESVAKEYDFDLNTPFRQLPKVAKNVLLYGTEDEIKIKYTRWDGTSFEMYEKFEGAIPHLMRIYKQTDSESRREWVERFMSVLPCPDCNGARLKKEALSVKINDLNINDITKMSVKRAYQFFTSEIILTEKERVISREVIKEIQKRLGFMLSVGLDYLTLDRTTETLGGGEEQRVRLATQIGSGLVGVVYILDEPSIGLHQRDNHRLLDTLKKLRDLGNTVIVVEHDKDTILSADYVIDLGPGAGEAGGYIVATGTPDEIKANKKSLTGAYLNGKKAIPIPLSPRKPGNDFIIIKGARENNLKNIDVKIPLGLFVCITGVSGSGKSTLMTDILYRALAAHFYGSKTKPGEHDKILNIDKIDKVINIDQSPIGRTPRSNPATYTNAFTPIRELFAQTKDARIRGYKPGRFSFNVRGGRCEACAGDGIIKIEMHFLPDVYVPCDVCKGKRYNRETLEIRYKGKNIYDVLNMTVTEALEFFANIPPIRRKLELLNDVGLGYIKLGQPAPTLSGGEAQRVKLAKELSKIATGRTLYLLDEPTTGLHFEDVRLLLKVLDRLVAMNNTVLVIEHNLEVIKCADWIIDLGPEGGDEGGYIVAEGPPQEVAKNEKSYTGKFLKKLLAQSPLVLV